MQNDPFEKVFGMLFPFIGDNFHPKKRCEMVLKELNKLNNNTHKLFLILIAKAINVQVFHYDRPQYVYNNIIKKISTLCEKIGSEYVVIEFEDIITDKKREFVYNNIDDFLNHALRVENDKRSIGFVINGEQINRSKVVENAYLKLAGKKLSL